MRAAELIGCRVYDTDGQLIGTVHDLHFEVGVSPDGEPVCYLDALECGGIAVGHRLGYGGSAMHGPWPLPALFGWLARRSQIVPWSAVSRFSRPSVYTTAQLGQLQPARDRRP